MNQKCYHIRRFTDTYNKQDNMTRTEKLLRKTIREHIKQYLKEAEGEEETQDAEETPKAEEEPQEEGPSLGTTMGMKFAERIKNTPGASDTENIHDILVAVIDSFGMSNERKLALLKQIKTSVVQ
jgi:hypothetical protein